MKRHLVALCGAFTLAAALSAPSQAAGDNARRISQQFKAWNMTCVEDRAQHTKRCGVTQDVMGAGGGLAFHWELEQDAAGQAHGKLSIAPLLPASVVVFRIGGETLVVDSAKCSAAGCTASFVASQTSIAALAAGKPASVQFIYLNASGSVLALPGEGFAEAWKEALTEMGANDVTGSIVKAIAVKPRPIGAISPAGRKAN